MNKLDKEFFVEYERELSTVLHIGSCGLITAGGLLMVTLGRKFTPIADIGLLLVFSGIATAPIATVNEVIYRLAK